MIYRGTRTDSCTDIRVTREGQTFDPTPSQEIWNHSPDGFNWGYGGSGPAQLALALLLDVTGDRELATRLHQRFKSEVISSFDDTWQYTDAQVKEWLRDSAQPQ